MPRKIPEKKVTLSLPPEVWDRLRAEGLAAGRGIGGHLRHLVIERDRKHQARKAAP